jgi:hypothetical protein
MASIGEAQAIILYKSEWWKGLSARQIVKFQLFVDELCMPFGEFHSAVGDALGRDVYTHEFGSSGVGQLQAEFRGDASARGTVGLITHATPFAVRRGGGSARQGRG